LKLHALHRINDYAVVDLAVDCSLTAQRRRARVVLEVETILFRTGVLLRVVGGVVSA
jgi:hypothetical protein